MSQTKAQLIDGKGSAAFDGDLTVDTNTLYVDSTNNRVGIGTTSPSVLVHGAVSSGAANLRLENTANSGEAGLQLYGKNSGGTVRTAVIKYDASDYFRIATSSAVAIAFETSDAERARIDSSGRLLVGTSSSVSPFNTPLQVASSGAQITVNRAFADVAGSVVYLSHTRSGVGGNTALLNGDELGSIQFFGADGTSYTHGASIIANVDGTPGANDMPCRLVFSTTADGASSPTERMRITSGGKILYNTTSPATANTAITIQAHDNGVGGSAVEISGWGNGRGHAVAFVAHNTANADVIYFATSSAVVGSISITSTSTAYNTSSDYRLKQNIAPVTDGITRLQQLKPSRFNFLADPDKVVDGFIAHEVQPVVPEAVTGTKDEIGPDGNPKYQGIDQSKLVPLLTAALQEAVSRIETLEAKVAALEAS